MVLGQCPSCPHVTKAKYRLFWDWKSGNTGESYRTINTPGLTLELILFEIAQIDMKTCIAQGADWRLFEVGAEN